jgi:ABC-type sugar transport system ATPase subunit
MENREVSKAGDGAIRLLTVSKYFADQAAVKDLSLEIENRELMVLLGPSGCGKTTTLNMLAGLEMPTSGQILFGDRDVTRVPPEERDISMVFQTIGLYPHLNVESNITFPLRLARVPQTEIRRRLHETTEMLGISGYLKRGLHQLSGGERQRVAIAKALVKRPQLFLLDEPFSSLDAAVRRQLRGELVRIHRELRTTMVFVTHDQEEAMSIADRIVVMKEGTLIQVGSSLSIYDRPANVWISRFIGSHPINVLEGTLEQADGNAYMRLPVGRLQVDPTMGAQLLRAAPTGRVVIGIRPEFLRLGSEDQLQGGVHAEVFTKQVLGTSILYALKSHKVELTAVVPSSERYDLGSTVRLSWDWSSALFFDASNENVIAISEVA